jgi:hypothetical protein
MNNYKVLGKQFEYEGCPIVIRQSGECFEFITVINNEIYSSFIVARKSFLRRITFKEYAPEQIKSITNYVIAMAQTTIDTVLGLHKEK